MKKSNYKHEMTTKHRKMKIVRLKSLLFYSFHSISNIILSPFFHLFNIIFNSRHPYHSSESIKAEIETPKPMQNQMHQIINHPMFHPHIAQPPLCPPINSPSHQLPSSSTLESQVTVTRSSIPTNNTKSICA